MQTRESILAEQRTLLERLLLINENVRRKFNSWADETANKADELLLSISETGLVEPITFQQFYLVWTGYEIAGSRNKKLSGYRGEALNLISIFNNNVETYKLIDLSTIFEDKEESTLDPNKPAIRSTNDNQNVVVYLLFALVGFIIYKRAKKK